MIQENFSLESQYKILQAFKELNLKKNEIKLPEEYSKIIQNESEIAKKHEQRTINLFYLKIIVENLLKDVGKVRTITHINQRLKELDQVFNDYSYDHLVEVFKELKNI
jgi:hypothetical protein